MVEINLNCLVKERSEYSLKSWGVQKSFSLPNDPLCEFLKFPRRVQKIISPQNDTNRDLFNIFHRRGNTRTTCTTLHEFS